MPYVMGEEHLPCISGDKLETRTIDISVMQEDYLPCICSDRA